MVKKVGKVFVFKMIAVVLVLLVRVNAEQPKRISEKTGDHRIYDLEKITRQSLDYSVWVNNPIREGFDEYPQAVFDKEKFKDVFDTISNNKPSLNFWEENHPMSFGALKQKLFEEFKSRTFQKIAVSIESERWNESSRLPFQTPEVFVLHKNGNSIEHWVRIDLQAKNMKSKWSDSNGDGFVEFWGRLKKTNHLNKKELSWVLENYCSKKMNFEETQDWAQVLASYWYPVFNTDLIPIENGTFPTL